MTRKLPSSLGPIAFVLMLATCGAQIVRSAVAAPVTVPGPKDVAKAERVAASRVGGEDTQSPMPTTGPGVVGGNGIVEPAQRETKVAAQVTAIVREVMVKEGDWVKPGQLLVQLDDAVERALLAAAEADAAAERANLGRTSKGLRGEDREAVQAESKAAQSKAELSASVLTRTEQLARSGAATQDELDRARRQAQVDLASYQATAARARAAEAGGRSEDVGIQKARLLAAEARVQQARAALERLAVRAPEEGEVLQVKVRPGELYSFSAAEPLLSMGNTRTLRVRVDVDERDIARVALGAEGHVTADAFGAQRFAGRVVEIGRRFGRKNVRTDDPVEKNDTKILEVVLELESNARLVPGQRVTGFISAQPPKS